jgi:hypothetical protein
MHGPNFTRPTPELIDGEEEYSIEKILDSRQFGRRRRLQYLVKWEGYPDLDNMWVNKDDVFAEDKVQEFKDSNPEAETHIRSSSIAKSPHPSALTCSQLLYQHTSKYMSSDGNNKLAFEYPAGAIADSPIPSSQTNPIDTPVSVPVPIVDFTTLQPLNTATAVFSPRPVTASSSASDITAMFRQLRVHTPAPLTPNGQRATSQANKTFTVLFTPAKRQGGQTSVGLEPGTAPGSAEAMGAMTTTAHRPRSHSHDSSADDNLRCCTCCGEQQEDCHGHTPFVPNPTLNLPPNPPRISVSGSVPPNGMARFNLSSVQATVLATRLVNSLKQNHQDTAEVPLAYDYGEEFAWIVAEGLSIPPNITAEGLGVQNRRGQHRGQGQGNRPQPVPDAQHTTNLQQTQECQPARRPTSPTLAGFEHNQGPAYIPFHIQENSHETLARYIRAHLDTPNPFVEGRLSLQGPTYHSEIHAAAIHDIDIPPPPITTELLRLLHTDYMGHNCVDEVLGELGDRSLITEVNHYQWLEHRRRSFQELITCLEDQLFTSDVEQCMCVSWLEGVRALVRIQGEMQWNQQAFCLSPWSLECGCLP